jgi:hypothetical protein
MNIKYNKWRVINLQAIGLWCFGVNDNLVIAVTKQINPEIYEAIKLLFMKVAEYIVGDFIEILFGFLITPITRQFHTWLEGIICVRYHGTWICKFDRVK